MAQAAQDLSASLTGLDALTPREREVAQLIARGLTNRQIAETLIISPTTVASHVEHILEKTGTKRRASVASLVSLDEPSRTSAQVPRPALPRVRWLHLWLAAAGVLFVGSFGGAATVFRPPAGPHSTPPGAVVLQDGFDDSTKSVFVGPREGVTVLPNSEDGGTRIVHWDYAYDNGALLAHVGAPSPPLSFTTRFIGYGPVAGERLSGDFAIEVRGRATKSVPETQYGLQLRPGAHVLGFGVRPAAGSYVLWLAGGESQPAVVAQSAAIARDDQENLLRLEVHGAQVSVIINDQTVDRVEDERLAERPTGVGIAFHTFGQPSDGSVGAAFRDFKVYGLKN